MEYFFFALNPGNWRWRKKEKFFGRWSSPLQARQAGQNLNKEKKESFSGRTFCSDSGEILKNEKKRKVFLGENSHRVKTISEAMPAPGIFFGTGTKTISEAEPEPEIEDEKLFICSKSWKLIMKKKRKKEKFFEMKKMKFSEDQNLFFCYFWRNLIIKKKVLSEKLHK